MYDYDDDLFVPILIVIIGLLAFLLIGLLAAHNYATAPTVPTVPTPIVLPLDRTITCTPTDQYNLCYEVKK